MCIIMKVCDFAFIINNKKIEIFGTTPCKGKTTPSSGQTTANYF